MSGCCALMPRYCCIIGVCNTGVSTATKLFSLNKRPLNHLLFAGKSPSASPRHHRVPPRRSAEVYPAKRRSSVNYGCDAREPISRLRPKERRGGKPRCHLLTHGSSAERTVNDTQFRCRQYLHHRG